MSAVAEQCGLGLLFMVADPQIDAVRIQGVYEANFSLISDPFVIKYAFCSSVWFQKQLPCDVTDYIED